jgi:hypothetical protein
MLQQANSADIAPPEGADHLAEERMRPVGRLATIRLPR